MMILGQFLTSAISSGLSMFRLTVVSCANLEIFFDVIFSKVEPFSSEFYSLLFFVSSVTTQNFLYCWFGNEAEFKVRAVFFF
jgi:hypothetical protein